MDGASQRSITKLVHTRARCRSAPVTSDNWGKANLMCAGNPGRPSSTLIRNLLPRVALMVVVVFVVMAHPGHRMRQISFIATLGHQVEQLISAVHRIEPTAVT